MKKHLSELFDSLSLDRGWLRLGSALALLILTLAVVCIVSPAEAKYVVRYGGYYFTLLGVILLLVYLMRAWRSEVFGRMRRQEVLIGFAAVLGGAWVVLIHADFGYKIAMDDYLLAATAKNLHESREVAFTSFGSHMGNTFVPSTSVVDKRPWFYPFVVASLHDLIGYRSANPFIINAGASIAFLGGVYVFAYLLAGRMAGLCAVFLWASVPLFAQNATGAGMEALNLCLLQGVLLLAVCYLRRPSSALEGALSLAAVLLTYTRYESGIFLIPVALLVFAGWWRVGRVLLSWGTVLAAPLLLAVALQTRIYAETQASWELAEGAVAPFSLNALLENIPHALHFFFSYDDGLANSLLLSVLGFPAILAFLVLLRTEALRYWKSNPAGIITAVFGVFLLVHLCVVLSFHASELDSPFVSRYALPIHVFFVFALIALCGYIAEKRPKVWAQLLTLTLLFILGFTLPMNAKAVFSKRSYIVRECYWLEELSREQLNPKGLIIDRYTVTWGLIERTALAPALALSNADTLAQAFASGEYPAGYVVERMHYENGEFVANLDSISGLHEVFGMKLLAERSFRPFELTRLYRLTHYHAPN
jgi:hypothetical protein